MEVMDLFTTAIYAIVMVPEDYNAENARYYSGYSGSVGSHDFDFRGGSEGSYNATNALYYNYGGYLSSYLIFCGSEGSV